MSLKDCMLDKTLNRSAGKQGKSLKSCLYLEKHRETAVGPINSPVNFTFCIHELVSVKDPLRTSFGHVPLGGDLR